jgi:hypothetical protein
MQLQAFTNTHIQCLIDYYKSYLKGSCNLSFQQISTLSKNQYDALKSCFTFNNEQIFYLNPSVLYDVYKLTTPIDLKIYDLKAIPATVKEKISILAIEQSTNSIR